MSELFDVGERKPNPKLKFRYATPDVPGSGPEGETCGNCVFLYRHEMCKTYFKCLKLRRQWTHGGATDVKVGLPACSEWESVELTSPAGRIKIVKRFWPESFGGKWKSIKEGPPAGRLDLEAIAIAADYWEDAGGTHQAAMLRAVVEAEK